MVFSFRKWIFFLVFCCILPVSSGYTTETAPSFPAIKTPSVHLILDALSGQAVSWTVPAEIPENLVSPAGNQMVTGGFIAGKKLKEWADKAGGWKAPASSENEVLLRLGGDGIPFVLEQLWRAGDHAGSLKLEIRLQSLASIGKPDLFLVMGPGIGSRPVSGLGMADGLYSYTEAIFKNKRGIHTLRAENSGERHSLDLPEEIVWAGLHSRYFAMIVKPQSPFAEYRIETPESPLFFPDAPSFESKLYLSLPFSSMEENESRTFTLEIFSGGKSWNLLKENQLQDILFSSLWQWMRLLVLGMMHLLYAIHGLVMNWGVSILILALLVRLAIHPVAKKAMESQRRFAELQKEMKPRIRAIKEKYRGGEQSERILHVYERYGVSPLAGLKPLVIVGIQIPVFIALFHLLGQAFELRSAGFLWITSLSEPDRLFSFGRDLPFFGTCFNLLPLLMSLTNLLSIKFSPAPADTEKSTWKNKAGLILLALGFFLLFYSFPSGMVLYWTMANLLHLAHTLWIRKTV
ncbi:YidC/Oxa1 family membrane protein insertase [Desulfobotulus alkaliphilus]|uniref:Membrane protein insertase YidC n=1 Tax=Desulfobotulus alkaliphilus TaxID=622671 RepID=A0A562RAF9_9BACT|nr:membrane protein insertase YidC [Desulfobotulus alkaliphilus]TWI66069.1 YidC/Oxa1 family membrane protein insertase [Desulfobotulus alkaliphilus]